MNDEQRYREYGIEEYIRQGEPQQRERGEAWKVAIGLQQVDGLKTSAYLLDTARKHIVGDINIADGLGTIGRNRFVSKCKSNCFIVSKVQNLHFGRSVCPSYYTKLKSGPESQTVVLFLSVILELNLQDFLYVLWRRKILFQKSCEK